MNSSTMDPNYDSQVQEKENILHELYNKFDENLTIVTPVAEDLMCCICGRILIVAYHNKNTDIFPCRFCPTCAKMLQNRRGKHECDIHKAEQILSEDVMTVTVCQLDLRKFLAKIDGYRTLFSFDYLIENHTKILASTYAKPSTSTEHSLPRDQQIDSTKVVESKELEGLKENAGNMFSDGSNQIEDVDKKQKKNFANLNECAAMTKDMKS